MAKLSRAQAVAGYLRKYPLAPRYGRARRVTLRAADGTRIAAHRLDGPPDARCTVVLVHGFVNSSRTPAIHAFAHVLADEVDVLVPDLRGHGRSGGRCTLGRDEPLDVAAAVAAADPSRPVVTVGVSLGGAAVLLHAGRHPGTVAGVVAISAPATWTGSAREGARRIERWVHRPGGRTILRVVLGTRLARDVTLAEVPDASTAVAAIAPSFTVVVADPDDWYFGPEHPEALYGWADDPRELWWYPGGGHGTDLLTTAFAARLLAAVEHRLPAAASGPASSAAAPPGGRARRRRRPSPWR